MHGKLFKDIPNTRTTHTWKIIYKIPCEKEKKKRRYQFVENQLVFFFLSITSQLSFFFFASFTFSF